MAFEEVTLFVRLIRRIVSFRKTLLRGHHAGAHVGYSALVGRFPGLYQLEQRNRLGCVTSGPGILGEVASLPPKRQ